MRLEANVSLREDSDQNLPDYKVELKNINSFGFLKKAVEAELIRQEKLIKNGEKVGQETRGFDEKNGKTVLQRVKEEANDYRYFPEPDLPPIRLSTEEIKRIKEEIPELPEDKRNKFRKLGLQENYIEVMIEDKNRAEYFEIVSKLAQKKNISIKALAGLIINQNLDREFSEPELLIKKVYELLRKDYAADDETKLAIEKVIKENSKAVADFKNGKVTVIGFLIGQVQKELKGKGEPKLVQQILKELLVN
jgi:aspartyl-tRNA(Asn)/glutamyl-tRNA(Gln) amidotransferase subunit B